jgi:imidazolonepropionase-like amidohydrolase
MDLLVTDARLWDGTGAPVAEGVDIHVRDGRIEAVGPDLPVPEGARVIEANGATVIPGLVDAHVHLAYDPGAALRNDPDSLHPTLLAHHLRAYLACGVTTVLDPAIPADEVRLVRETLEKGAGPRFLTLGPPLSPAGGYVSVVIPEFPSVSTPADVERMLDENAALGVAGVKLTYEDGLLRPIWPTYSEEMQAAIVAGTDARGLRRFVHAMTVEEQEIALEGLRPHAFVHPPDKHDPEHAKRVADAGVPVMSTLAVLGVLEYGWDPDMLDDPLLQLTVPEVELETADDPELVRDFEKRMIRSASPRIGGAAGLAASFAFRRGPVEKRVQAQSEAVLGLHEAGATVVMGSDSGNWPVMPYEFHGPTSIVEVEMLGRAGLTNEEALLAATRNAAQLLAPDGDFGTVTIGKAADFLVVDGDPLTDLEALRSLRYTVRGGEAKTPAEWMAAP